MFRGPLEEWIRKPVVVRANGFIYKGVLLEVGPDEIILRRDTAYTSIPIDRIVSLEGPSPQRQGPFKAIDPSFYTAEENESLEDPSLPKGN